MKLKTFFIVCIFVIFSSVSLNADFEDRIVAIVNDEVITLSELDITLQSFMKRVEKIPQGAQREKIVAQARGAAMDKLINDMLLEQKAAKLGIIVTDKDVDKILKNILEEKHMSVEKFREALAREGSVLVEYKGEIRRNIISGRIIEKEIRSGITISEEEVGAYYSKHRDDYEGKEAARIQQILFVKPKDCDDSIRKELRVKAEETLKRLKNGESFGVLVGMYSQGPAAKSGGDLGFVEKGMMFPEVDTAVSGLKKGESSEVIESPVGFHIIRVIDRRGAGIKPVEEVREEIIRNIGNEKITKKFQEWLKELREKSLVEIKL
ncbi:MAG: peptidyl-prolyl cis-trans isomerase [Thermodesulfobacteriota bacterium]|nr:peptidyl-prolyl cis-trans isomerase [Thermodesulfobacteriota bacterium]